VPESNSIPTPVPMMPGFCRLERSMKQTCLQVYTGPGKGKTTAATGLIVRALGQGFKVLLVRFLKSDSLPSSELEILKQQSKLEIITAGVGGVEARKRPEELRKNVTDTFMVVKPLILSGDYDLVVLDEFNGVLHQQYLPLEDGLALLDQRPANTELVLTGRNAPPEVRQRAELVTEMLAEKHPFEQGIPARPGIEY
jgi:cob(I)alamin adenosyltransferase